MLTPVCLNHGEVNSKLKLFKTFKLGYCTMAKKKKKQQNFSKFINNSEAITL